MEAVVDVAGLFYLHVMLISATPSPGEALKLLCSREMEKPLRQEEVVGGDQDGAFRVHQKETYGHHIALVELF